MRRKEIMQGFRDGIPIALGYFAVAFSLGIIAKQAGLSAVMGFVSSFFTRASAGEYGVYTLVAAQAAYAEIVAMCLVVNLRYMLMSAALTENRPWHLVAASCADGQLRNRRDFRHLHRPPALLPARLHLFRCPYLYAVLGVGLCGWHCGWRHAAC